MRRAIAGDAAAFGELTVRHRPSALRVAAVVTGASSNAEDVVQDADIRAWRARASIDPTRPFRSWYLHVVANAAKNAHRSWRRRTALELRAPSAGSPVIDPAEQAVTEDERRLVIAAVNRLGRDDRLVIALRHFEQLGEAEMADVIGCAPGTVKSRLSRAMARLRVELEEVSSR